MRRLVVCLTVCLLVAPDRADPGRSPPGPAFILPPTSAPVAGQCDAAKLPTDAEFSALAKTDPLAALNAGVCRWRRELRGFNAVIQKQERINGRLNPEETIDVAYRREPHSVLLRWISEPTGLADRVLFVEGENDNLMLARPKSRLARAVAGAAVARDPDGPEARQGGLVSLRQFGLLKAAERVAAAWDQARVQNRLTADFVGLQSVSQAGDRPCYLFRRTIDPPAEDGLASVLIGLDAETWLQVVNVLTDRDGRTMAAYYFRDVVVNPSFPTDLFERDALLKSP